MKLMQKKIYEFDFSGKYIYAGIDVHLKSWTVSMMIEGILCKCIN